MGEKIIVIGGTAAGLSAASKAKRVNPELEITVYEKTGYVSYGACGLPYFIGDMIKEPEDLVSLSVTQLQENRGITTHIHHEVLRINREDKVITVKNLDTGEVFSDSYDKLVIATGGKAIVPQIPGADESRVYTLRSVEDGIRLKKEVKERKAKKAVVIGGGFIGLEVVEELTESGLKVDLVEAMPRLLPFLAEEYSQVLQQRLEDHGVKVYTGTTATAVHDQVVATDTGERLDADFILFAIGSQPESSLAQSCGLETGLKNAIIVDEYLQTSDPSIWACGDCVQMRHLLSQAPVYIPLGTTANKQGRIAGGNIAGEKSRFKGVLGSMVTKVFDLYIAATGLTLAQAREAGYSALSTAITKGDRASYYPGSADNHLTLVFEEEGGRLLGAQGIGSISVAGRMNLLVAAITMGMTVHQLNELDLLYSPSVAPVYDPLLIAASQGLKKVK